MKFHPDVLRCHEQFGGDLEEMQRNYDFPVVPRPNEKPASPTQGEDQFLRERDEARAELAEFDETNRMMVKHADIRKAELERLRKALEPFAKACPELFNDTCPDDTPAWWNDYDDTSVASSVTVGDFRSAAIALASTQPEHGGRR